MNKKEYLLRLRRSLQGFPQDEINDILSDYEEHFQIGTSKGKTEEEISRELGKPEDIAKTYRGSYKDSIDRIENDNSYSSSNDSGRKILIALALIFFNLIFVLGLFLGIIGIFIGIYATGISFVVAGFAFFIGSPFIGFTPIPTPHILTSLSFGIGFIALGILVLIGAVYLSKLFIQLTIKYVKWNIKLINGKEEI